MTEYICASQLTAIQQHTVVQKEDISCTRRTGFELGANKNIFYKIVDIPGSIVL